MSCNSAFSFTLIRRTLPLYNNLSSSSSIYFPTHVEFLSFKNSPPLSRFLLTGDSPEFPQKSPVPEPAVPLEVPQISTRPEIDPISPPELPPVGPGPDFPAPPGPEFPTPPIPSPPGIDVPLPPHRPPDVEPPMPGSPVPEPEILPPAMPEEVPPRPTGPGILTSPSPPEFVPPMGLV